jgi:hypothetical protein
MTAYTEAKINWKLHAKLSWNLLPGEFDSALCSILKMPNIFKSILFAHTFIIWTDGYQGVQNTKIERNKCYQVALE